jgi:hypothetical protein
MPLLWITIKIVFYIFFIGLACGANGDLEIQFCTTTMVVRRLHRVT